MSMLKLRVVNVKIYKSVLNSFCAQRVVASNQFLKFSTNKNDDHYNDNSKRYWFTGTLLAFGAFAFADYFRKNSVKAKQISEEDFGKELPGLKFYSRDELAKHNAVNKRVWVSFRNGVYDITDFIDKHPGGDKIMMAAGGALEPFWMLYAIHKTDGVLKILEEYRIGNLDPKDREKSTDESDPYSSDPFRHPALQPSSVKPFNAETPLPLLVQNFHTPNDLFYVRNHLPVPEIDSKTYTLEIEGLGLKSSKKLSLDEIKKFPKHTVTAAIQCAGNRRSEINQVKPVKGLNWGSGAIGNAQWSGARLVDVLKHCGLDCNDKKIKHVQFEGYDFDITSHHYGGSVTSDVALDPRSEFLLAYEMNGQELSRDHGFPIRLIAPGIAGARNVKWLKRIVLSSEESDSFWQRRDYKSFSPSDDWDTADFDKALAIQEMPVQSVICDPVDGEKVKVKNGEIIVKGYAWSGGGRKIIRVDVTSDEKNWVSADLFQESSPLTKTWSWTLWEAKIKIPKNYKKEDKIEIICKATDSSYNVQPENFKGIWNLRGVLGNAWHRVNINVVK